MTPVELRHRLDDLGLSQAAFARRLTEETGSIYARQHVHRWVSGAREIPGPIAALVRAWQRVARQPAPALVTLEPVPLRDAKRLLTQWFHQHGPISRPVRTDAHLVRAHGEPVAVLTTSELVCPPVAGEFYRDDAIELSRLCCADPSWSRVALRLWRNTVFPMYRRRWAVSYQDTALHRGDLYRFDGWIRLADTRPGADRRTGRKPTPKVVWGWSSDAQLLRRYKNRNDATIEDTEDRALLRE